ncbi:hypothetical protein AN641_04100 [Candidatus Epulonipiscioides gigas]|nr:hypothetical protein AN641_04100 [Epulopiscium sp. SCG-C07WGA-EpuloA2]
MAYINRDFFDKIIQRQEEVEGVEEIKDEEVEEIKQIEEELGEKITILYTAFNYSIEHIANQFKLPVAVVEKILRNFDKL